MVVINYRDPARGFIRVPGDRLIYESMAAEEIIHVYHGDTLTAIVCKEAIDRIAVDARGEL